MNNSIIYAINFVRDDFDYLLLHNLPCEKLEGTLPFLLTSSAPATNEHHIIIDRFQTDENVFRTRKYDATKQKDSKA